MSTVVVVKKNGYVAMAAETLTSFGSCRLTAQHNAGATKILQVGQSYIGVTGSSVHQLVLAHLFGSLAPVPAFATREEVFEVFRALHPRLKQEYFLNAHGAPTDPYESSQMSLLIANRFGIFGFYRLRDVFEYERFWANGSGEEYALGAMQAVYDTALDAVQIAEAGVAAAVAFDEYSGGPIESRVIELDAVKAVGELELLMQV